MQLKKIHTRKNRVDIYVYDDFGCSEGKATWLTRPPP